MDAAVSSPTAPEMDGPGAVIELEKLMAFEEITEEQLILYAQNIGMANKKQKHLRELSTSKLIKLIAGFKEASAAINASELERKDFK